jgi:GTPase
VSEFVDYVERQQRKRPRVPTDHTELEILDSLNLAEAEPYVPLRTMLLSPDKLYVDRLVSVVESRLKEGQGEAIIDIGVEENGDAMPLDKDEFGAALLRLEEAASRLHSQCQLLLSRHVGGDQEAESTRGGDRGVGNDGSGKILGGDRVDCSGKILVRQRPATAEDVIETRIAVVGNVDAGKSTTLGVLVKGELDDGRGRARVNLFRHKHEMETGRTSSVGMEIMGFDAGGKIVTSDVAGRKLSWEEIGRKSAKVISFTDLAGHERYLRTTVFGMLSSSPHYCLLMVAANNGLVGMSREHLGIALALNVPVMVVITKVDICPPQILEQSVLQITKILKSPGARKMPILVGSREECVETATRFVSGSICPVFQVSNVTGLGLDLLRTFLNILPRHGQHDAAAPFQFHVNDTFSVPFVGTVVSGIVKSGSVRAGDSVLVGPDFLGQFQTTTIRSIERKRIPVASCSAGHSASFALRRVRRRDVRKGMVLLKLDAAPSVYREFVAEGTSPRGLSPADRCSAHPQPRHDHQGQLPGHAARRARVADVRHHRH